MDVVGRVLFILVLVASFSIPSLRPNNYLVCSAESEGMSSFSKSIQERLNMALELHQKGEEGTAMTAYESLIPSLSGKVACSVLSNMGAIAMSKGTYTEAQKYFAAAQDHDKTSVSAFLNEAIVLTSKLGDHKRAMTKCVRALQLDDKNPKVYHLLGNIMQEMGRDEQAKKYFVMAENLAAEGEETGVQPGSGETTGEGTSPLWAGATWAAGSPWTKLKVGQKGSFRLDETDYSFECLSEEPLVLHITQFLSGEETQHIVERAGSHLRESFVMGGDAGYTVDDVDKTRRLEEQAVDSDGVTTREGTYRQSENAWLSVDDTLASVQRRLATLLGLQGTALTRHSEELQVVRYEAGGEFKLHHDSSHMHPRLFTCLMYLNSVEEGDGGLTWFPHASAARSVSEGGKMDVAQAISMASQSQDMGVHVRPQIGDALLFFNHDVRSGSLSPFAVHSSTPLTAGIKWIANYWCELNPALFK